MRIVEATAFERNWRSCLRAPERRALDLLLADDPAAGRVLQGFAGIFVLDYAGSTIYYSVTPDLSELVLLDIHPIGEAQPQPTKEQRSRRKQMLVPWSPAA